MSIIQTIPPMPATDCPPWCEMDHAADWEHAVLLFSVDVPIPQSDGTTVVSAAQTPEQVAQTWEPLHLRTIASRALEGSERATVDVQSAHGYGACVYLDCVGALTTVQARAVATDLQVAADLLDRLDVSA